MSYELYIRIYCLSTSKCKNNNFLRRHIKLFEKKNLASTSNSNKKKKRKFNFNNQF